MRGGKIDYFVNPGSVLIVASKLGNILFTRELARRLNKRGSAKVYANCFFPGK
jgi:NAD(P)-dependent dehydrogenase (short-subunit alcohol dehydrogenase family)